MTAWPASARSSTPGAGLVLFTALDDLLGRAERIAAEVIPAL